MHASSLAGARFAKPRTFIVLALLLAAYLPLSGGCPGSDPADLTDPLELVADSSGSYDLEYDVATMQDEPVTITLNDVGLSDVIEYLIVEEPTSGTLGSITWPVGGEPELTYTPDDDFVGQAGFSYEVSNAAADSKLARVRITVYPEVRFDVEIVADQPDLEVSAYAFTSNAGAELPEGTYAWQFDEQEESGPVETHSGREYVFTSGGSHVITLTLTLAGLAGPISCSTGVSGNEVEYRVSSSSEAGVLAVSPDDDLESVGPLGGPFDPASMSYELSNVGGEPLDWSVSNTQNWVSLSRGSGTLEPGESVEVIVSINDRADGFESGTYSDTVTFTNDTSGDATTSREVLLTVSDGRDQPDPGILEVTPAGDFATSGPQGGPFSPDGKTYTVTNAGGLPVRWQALSTQDWVSLSKTGGNLPAGHFDTVVVSINADANALDAGSYSDSVAFTNTTNGDGNTSRDVSLTVEAPLAPGVLVVSPEDGFSSSGPPGGPYSPESREYTLENTGDEPIDWEASNLEYWVALSSTSGTLAPHASVTLLVWINDDEAERLGPSVHSDTVSIANVSNGNGDSARPVLLTVTDDLVICGNVSDSSGAGIGGVVMNGLPGDPVSNVAGDYAAIVELGFSATVTPVKAGYDFSPASRTYTDVDTSQTNQDYTGTLRTFVISGRVTDGDGAAISGVVISGLPDSPVTDANGDYSATVDYGFSGIAIPSKAGYDFAPASRIYSSVTADQSNQDYTGTLQTFVISGSVTDGGGDGVSGVVINGLPGSPATNSSGDYSATVDYGFSGTAIPSKAGYNFAPASRTYSSVTADRSNQNYTGTLQTFVISGRVTDDDGAAISGVVISGLPDSPATNSSGDYSATVDYGFSGTAIPSKAGYDFAPGSRTYGSVTADQSNQNYTGTLQTFVISGRVTDGDGAAISGVVISGLPDSPATNSSGDYSATVDYGFSGTAIPSKAGYDFAPGSRTYGSVTADQSNQNYTGTLQTVVISGNVADGDGAAISGVVINGLPDNPVTDTSGDYSATVDYGFSGTATPSKAGYDFSPASRTYSGVAADQSNQDYAGTLQTVVISGSVTDGDGAAISGVLINGLPGDPSTDASGDYSATVDYGFSGTAVPSKAGYTFSPSSIAYSSVTSAQTDQDYVGTASGDCVTSTTDWQNFALDSQDGLFTLVFDAIPAQANMDGVTALSLGAGAAYSDFAILIRFNSTGEIDVRNGGAYTADTAVSYTPDLTYHFRLEVAVPAHTYSVFVTPDGSSERTLASDYAFRTEQGDVAGLNNVGIVAAVGSHEVCNVAVTASEPAPGVIEVTPETGLSSSGAVGGPFTPASAVYTVRNTGSGDIFWTASSGAGWLTVSPDSGTLGGDQTVTVTVSINSNANELSAGTYDEPVTFSNTTNGLGDTTRDVSLTVNALGEGLTPIARWDAVPYQRINAGESLALGVVAFSKAGIASVDFTISGQGYTGPSPLTVADMSLNERTGVFEYWIEIDADDFTSDGPITVEASVHGNDGGVRDATTDGGGQGLDALPLVVNHTGTLVQPEAWVDVDGDDSIGEVKTDGVPGAPFRSIRKAADAIRAWRDSHGYGDNADGGIVRLNPGTYSETGSSVDQIECDNEWLTVTTAAGGTRANTIVTAQYAIYNIERVAIKGITLQRVEGQDFIVNCSSSLMQWAQVWVNDCDVLGYNRHDATPHPVGLNPQTKYWTDCYVYNVRRGTSRGDHETTKLARGLTIYHIGGDAFQAVPLIINCTVEDMDPGDTGWHADAWQSPAYNYEAGMHNWIVYGLWATDLHYQGIYGRQTAPCSNIAFVNVLMELRDPIRSGGGGSAQHGMHEHLLYWNCTFIGTDVSHHHSFGAGPDGFSKTNCSFRGNLWSEWTSAEGLDWTLADDIEFYDNHYITGSQTPDTGSTMTLGDPGLVTDVSDSRFGRPVDASSPLIARIDPTLTIVDVSGVVRQTPAAVGACEE